MVVVRRVLWLLVVLAAVIGAVLAVQSKPGGKQDSPTVYAGAGIGGPFTLTGSDGKTVTDLNLEYHWTNTYIVFPVPKEVASK